MFVSDEIQAEYKQWEPGDIVLIHAQTGAGKTYFVLNVLLPFVRDRNKKLLYLSNRTALREQVERSYPSELADCICSMNYQSFERVDLDRNNPSDRGKSILDCEYWVMDEAHYYLADGSFNSDVLACLRRVKSEQKNRVLIFMTATPEYLLLGLGQEGLLSKKPPTFEFDTGGNYHKTSYMCKGWLRDANLVYQLSSPSNLLMYKEATDKDRRDYDNYLEALQAYNRHPEEWFYEDQLKGWIRYRGNVPDDKFQKKYQEYLNFFEAAKNEITYYHSASGYACVCPVYFKTLDQLCKEIQKTPEQEKWLIFVSSKNRGEEIKACLLDENIKSVVITAETKRHKAKRGKKQPEDYEVYQSIIKEEKSSVRVTIATAVLDNGVNLKDPCLKHIVILEMNQTSFMQMLGRKRLVKPGERFKLYLQKKDMGEIKGYFQRAILKYVKFISELKFVNSEANASEKIVDKRVIANLQSFESAYQVEGNFQRPYCYYVQQTNPDPRPKNGLRTYMCRFYEPNHNMTVQLAYDYYRMLALMESYENASEEAKKAKKETLWIEHQLSWLGLKYDPSCWIDYKKHVASEKMASRILTRSLGQALSKNSQKKLRRAIIDVVNTSHPPMEVKIGKGSLKKINEALAELGYSQRIVSKNKSIGGKQRNYWIITSCQCES